MISRRAFTCLRLSRTYQTPIRRIKYGSFQRRTASTASSTTAAPPPSALSPLAGITSELEKLTPRFDIPADSIEIIRSPAEFYETLKAKITGARKRVFLATLYVGDTEHDLISTVADALESNPELKIAFLGDNLRCTRAAPNPSCASLLASLVQKFGPERVEVNMYHTPNLTGVRKAIIPKRVNEGWGLQHMKLYGIDDEIIISGANLSSDYFTNRQDRYHVFKSKEITDYFYKVYQAVCSVSYRVLPSDQQSGFVLDWPEKNAGPAPLDNPKEYVKAASAVLAPLLRPSNAAPNVNEKSDTHVFPLLQLTQLLEPNTSTELPALTGILSKLSTQPFSGSKWTFTAGYFNMTSQISQLLLQSNPASATVVAASPWANGFYGSKGVSGLLPAGYSYLARQFLDSVTRSGLSNQITIKEWRRGTVNTPGGWSYHAKGIWITLPNEEDPSISLVGSSNYTKRSYWLDLEANALIVTRNRDLQRRLGDEAKWLQEYATPMTRDDYAKTERRVGLHVRIAMWIVTLVGGAL